MKMKALLVIVILTCVILSPAFGSEIETIAQQYLLAFKNKRFLGAAKKLHCPESYNTQEYDKDIKSISKILRIFYEEFGPLIKAKVSENTKYITVSAACGNVTYWKQHPPSKQLVYKTFHKGNYTGYIVLSFSKIKGRYVFAFANHGLSMFGEGSVNKVRHVFRRISKGGF